MDATEYCRRRNALYEAYEAKQDAARAEWAAAMKALDKEAGIEQ